VLVRRVGFFALVVIGWVFFRSGSVTHESIGTTDIPTSADSLSMAMSLLGRMFSATDGALGQRPEVFAGLIAVAAWWSMAGPNVYDLHRDRADRKPRDLHEGFRWTVVHTPRLRPDVRHVPVDHGRRPRFAVPVFSVLTARRSIIFRIEPLEWGRCIAPPLW